jgi:methylmalonyl-CoA mutase, C-terminal domain
MENIRILITVVGLDQHEVGAIAIAKILRDAGMEVVYTGRFNLPSMILKTAVEEDVQVIGLSCHSWEYLYYIDELLGLLKERSLAIPVIIGGSVITPADRGVLQAKGVAAIFDSSSTKEEIIQKIKEIVVSQEKYPGSSS